MAKYLYGFHEERGFADLYVTDRDGKTVWEAHYPSFYESNGEMMEETTIFEDGFMKDSSDIEGLESYLKSISVINKGDELVDVDSDDDDDDDDDSDDSGWDYSYKKAFDSEYAAGGTIEAKIKKRLKNAFELPIQIAVYVPSTRDKDIIITKREMEARVEDVQRFLANAFGGFSAVKVEGGFESSDKGLIQEDAVRVVAFASKENENGIPFEQSFESLMNQVKNWCSKWSQQSIGLEFENDLFYVDSETKFGKGGEVEDEVYNTYVIWIDDNDEAFFDGGWWSIEDAEDRVSDIEWEEEGKPRYKVFAVEYDEDYFENKNWDITRLKSYRPYGSTKMAKGGKTYEYETYHDTLASALNEADKYVESKGLKFTDETYFPDVTMGGISYGQTARLTRGIQREGKKKEDVLIVVIYRMDSGKYELTMYTSYKKGGTAEDVQLNNIVWFREEKGNFFVEKDTVYAWLYDDPKASEKLQSGEYDYVLFPPSGGLGLRWQKGYVPPLQRIWTKKYQDKTKGSDRLIGIVQGWYDEENKKLYIDMMTTRKDMRRKGVNSHIIRELRKELGLEREQVEFVNTTKEGEKFSKSSKYADGGYMADGGEVRFVDKYSYKDGIEILTENTSDGRVFYKAQVVMYPLYRTIASHEDKDFVIQRAKKVQSDMALNMSLRMEDGGKVPSKKEMLDYLKMYFKYYSELRTIAEEENGILTKRMLPTLDDEQIEMAYEDAKYELNSMLKYENYMEDGGSIAEGNAQMLRSNAKAIKHHAEELEDELEENPEVEAWVVAKGERAATDLSDITHYLDGRKFSLGGMTAGRWYKDNSGEEFKFIGKVDSGANKGRFLFSDGQKSVYKDLEDFEGGRPKETKLFGFFGHGGDIEHGVDLFQDYESMPIKVLKVLGKYDLESGDYRELEKALKDLNKIGYTFEYELDGEPYDLRKIGQKGKSEFYAKGGSIKSLEKRVAEVNELIKRGNDLGIEVVDEGNTWQAPMKYKPLKYTNGVLYVSYEQMDLYKYSKEYVKEWEKKSYKVGKYDNSYGFKGEAGSMQREVLTDIARMYRKPLKSYDTYGYFEDGGEVNKVNPEEMKAKIEDILNKVVPSFYKGVSIHKNIFDTGNNIRIFIAASDYKINNVAGQLPQVVSLSLDLSDMDLHPQVFGGNGGQRIEREPNMNDPKEKYLAMKGVKVPFRTPQPNEKAVLDAIKRFAENYKKTLADNREVLMYQDVVDYDKLLAGSQYADGGMMAKGGVIASSKTKEGIEKLISDYYYSSNISLKKVDNKEEYEVSNSKGKINGVKVVLNKGRYQFVESDKMAMGGTFASGVKAIEKRLVGTKVKPKYQKEYGKTYDKAEAHEAASKIKGKIRAMELAKKYKKKK